MKFDPQCAHVGNSLLFQPAVVERLLQFSCYPLRIRSSQPARADADGVGPIIYMLPRELACMLCLTSSGKRVGNRLSSFANRSCKRQIRLRSDLSGSHLLPSEYTDVYYRTDPLPAPGSPRIWASRAIFANVRLLRIGDFFPELLNRRLNEALICNEKQERFQSQKPLQPLSAKGLE